MICHGAEDSFILEETAQKFREALDTAGADYEMIYYAGARPVRRPASGIRPVPGFRRRNAASG